MAEITFRFRYQPRDGAETLDAYDASQALYGIARSLAILTHYTVNQTVIKQAPALKGARVLVEPPQPGSFEFVVPVISAMTDPATALGAVTLGLGSQFLFALVQLIYNRLSGKAESTTNPGLSELIHSV